MKIKFLNFLIIVLIVGGLVIQWFNFTSRIKLAAHPVFGVTFSRFKAEELKLDWRETYLAILDDLKVKHLRLGAYWDDIETQSGQYDFSNLDWQIEEAEKHGAQIILAIGFRLPGWPECHLPEWAMNLSEKDRQAEILRLMETVIHRYKDRPNIWAWQVENEPFFSRFGLCPTLDREFFDREITMVKSIDGRPIIVTASGELSTWITESRYADILGITMYRSTWNKYFSYFYYPQPAASYYLKGKFVQFLQVPKKIIVVELQGEPWPPNNDLLNTPIKEQYKTMSPARFGSTIKYAQSTGFDEFYFWGAEWWYWLEKQGQPDIWQEAKELWTNQ